MRTASFIAIIDALNKAHVLYIVVGGMAVIVARKTSPTSMN